MTAEAGLKSSVVHSTDEEYSVDVAFWEIEWTPNVKIFRSGRRVLGSKVKPTSCHEHRSFGANLFNDCRGIA